MTAARPPGTQPALFIGLMSGTSMDGIDAALVDFTDGHAEVLATHCRNYPPSLQHQLEDALAIKDPRAADLTALDERIGEEFADAATTLLESSGRQPNDIIAIGSHGQTIRHEPDAPEPYSLQLGNAGIICQHTGVDTVADFRSADIAAGGQGAPLVPAFHAAVLRSSTENRAVVNIGGIANITILPADAAEAVTGFDTGPGNTLMDIWIRQHRDERFDRYGEWAASGETGSRMLAAMLQDPYFHTAPPKSTGREYFNRAWLADHLQGEAVVPADVQATLCELTAASIADAIGRYAKATQRVLVCGGGAHNRHLMTRLQARMDGIPVEPTGKHGIDPDWVEAAAFAWLAKQHLEGAPGNLPAVTGAIRPVVLGTLFRKQATAL